MKIAYNLTGAARKALVAAISQELDTKSKYLFAPTLAYEVGEYIIDKNGTVSGPDNRELVADLQGLHSFVPESVEYDEYPDVDQHYQGQYSRVPTTEEMLRHAEAWMEGQPGEDEMLASDIPDPVETLQEESEQDTAEPPIIEDVLTEDVQTSEDDTPEPMQEKPAPTVEDALKAFYIHDPAKTAGMTIEMPLDGFNPEKLENLNRLVSAKAPLLKAALAADDLPIQFSNGTIRFPWFAGEHLLTGEETAAYSTLIAMLCKAAKEKKRVLAKEKTIEGSPKYAMRCFLLSLGFIGEEYKSARKVLLSKLEGSAAWKNK